MDIRNFFGNKTGIVQTKPKPDSSPFPVDDSKKKTGRVVVDDEDNEINLKPVASVPECKELDSNSVNISKEIFATTSFEEKENIRANLKSDIRPEIETASSVKEIEPLPCGLVSTDANIPSELIEMIDWKCGENVPYKVLKIKYRYPPLPTKRTHTQTRASKSYFIHSLSGSCGYFR